MTDQLLYGFLGAALFGTLWFLASRFLRTIRIWQLRTRAASVVAPDPQFETEPETWTGRVLVDVEKRGAACAGALRVRPGTWVKMSGWTGEASGSNGWYRVKRADPVGFEGGGTRLLFDGVPASAVTADAPDVTLEFAVAVEAFPEPSEAAR